MIDFLIFLIAPKSANTVPLFKTQKKSRGNYRPVSFLPNVSKTYERCRLFCRMSSYFLKVISKCQYGLRQGLSLLYCLISMTEKYKKPLDNGNIFSALLTDLSKAFYCLPHEIIVGKLNV